MNYINQISQIDAKLPLSAYLRLVLFSPSLNTNNSEVLGESLFSALLTKVGFDIILSKSMSKTTNDQNQQSDYPLNSNLSLNIISEPLRGSASTSIKLQKKSGQTMKVKRKSLLDPVMNANKFVRTNVLLIPILDQLKYFYQKKLFSQHNYLQFHHIFDLSNRFTSLASLDSLIHDDSVVNTDAPIKIEICSGIGEWVVDQVRITTRIFSIPLG